MKTEVRGVQFECDWCGGGAFVESDEARELPRRWERIEYRLCDYSDEVCPDCFKALLETRAERGNYKSHTFLFGPADLAAND